MFKRKYCLPMITIIVTAYLAITLTGCNAIGGLGKDISTVAEKSDRLMNGQPMNQRTASVER